MSSEQTIVTVDKDLEDLIPIFMDNRRKDVALMRQSLAAGEMDKIRITGHSMKGTGGGYGFDEISAIGADIEKAAEAGDAAEIERLVDRLEAHLANVVIRFE